MAQQNNKPSLNRGVKIIQSYLQSMPGKAGVYRMLDDKDEVIYVGKAKDLSKRVASYTRPAGLPYRIQMMIAATHKMEIITTNTESEALILEANLIKKFSPKYNILLKDDKSYPYIFIDTEHKYPRIVKHRGSRDAKGYYFGPFPSAGALNQAIKDIQKAFLIRTCSDSYFKARTRACLEYQIERCSAPCVGKISQAEYIAEAKQAKDFLCGKSIAIQQQLQQKMHEASDSFDYEKAAVYRDRIASLSKIQSKSYYDNIGIMNADVMGFYQESGECCVQVFFIRNGQNLGNSPNFITNVGDMSPNEIMESFLSLFYQNTLVPQEILLPFKVDNQGLLEQVFTKMHTKGKVIISIPQKGKKSKLIEQAMKNSKESLQQKFDKKIKNLQILQQIKDIFDLACVPKRIEVYDNSHIMGSNEIGAMVVANATGFDKKSYRRFNMKSANIGKGDDYAMVRETLTRRFKRLTTQDHNDDSSKLWPDLIIIDGGKGQLSAAMAALQDFDLTDKIDLICISKGPNRNASEEQFHLSDGRSLQFRKTDPILHYLQILRDEVHNYAINSHRKQRKNSMLKSQIDDIEGVGSKRKKLLLEHFGSIREVARSSVEDLARVAGINKKLAQQIYDFFN